jgi:hypothetical protein
MDRYIQRKINLICSASFIQEYSTHPFIDLYVTKVNKGDAFEFVISKLSEMSNVSGKIIYLEDSENYILILEKPIFQLE